MILRIIGLLLVLCGNFTPTLFAGGERGRHLINEAGGVAGLPGVAGPAGAPGIAGAAGSQGIQGVPGIPGAPGLLDFADFFALMPIDNPLPIPPGSPVEFPLKWVYQWNHASVRPIILFITSRRFLFSGISSKCGFSPPAIATDAKS